MTDQIKSVAATHPIRQAAFRYADKMRESEDFMADIDSNLIAIETAKHSSLTMLWDIRQIFTQEELDELIASIPDDDAFGSMLGPDTVQGVKELLMKRLNVQTWQQVLSAFGVGSAEDIELEDA